MQFRAEYYALKNDIRNEYVKRVENVYICNVKDFNGKICNTILSVNKKPSHLLQHFYFYHRDLYDRFKNGGY